MFLVLFQLHSAYGIPRYVIRWVKSKNKRFLVMHKMLTTTISNKFWRHLITLSVATYWQVLTSFNFWALDRIQIPIDGGFYILKLWNLGGFYIAEIEGCRNRWRFLHRIIITFFRELAEFTTEFFRTLLC